jgi:hypothetical protein
VDYTLEVKSIRNLHQLSRIFGPREIISLSAVVDWKGWRRGRIIGYDNEFANVYLFDFKTEEKVPVSKVIPNLPKMLVERLLQQENIRFNLGSAIKQHSLALEPNAARIRAEKASTIARELAETIFPLRFEGLRAILQPAPTALPRYGDSKKEFVVNSITEPSVEFNHHQESPNIRDGITKFGVYDNAPRNIELVPICTTELRDKMAGLIERLKVGKYKYHGSERTFGTRFFYSTVVTVSSPGHILTECKRILKEHPGWIGNEQLDRAFLICTPESGYSTDDESSPYYQVKRFILESGVPCQMVDTPTLENPDWKDLNLALNITAKCGVTPWVLPGAIPDADFFIGLSYTQSGKREKERLLGYANVFNQYGRWMFYSGSMTAFNYDKRTVFFEDLVRETLGALQSQLSEAPRIYFHYSAKFSKTDREAILKAARSIRPNGIYSFVWINTHHAVRLYDRTVETDGSLRRGSYVSASQNQIYLSTTGYNPYRKALGTPHMLEVTIRTEQPSETVTAPDLKALAAQILSLTKLNWASTDSLCAEPITTKYAGDIAYLTSAFLRQGQPFSLHRVLERTPWFI